MSILLNKIRKLAIKENSILKFFIYAIGEILIIIIGIMIAVQINNSNDAKKESAASCIYISELKEMIHHDKDDSESNIRGINRWNPVIKQIITSIENKSLTPEDTLYQKLGYVGRYIFFGQRSKSKIDELVYSPVNLIPDRILKNEIILYQNFTVSFLRVQEERYNFVDEKIRQYYYKYFDGYSNGTPVPHDLKALLSDPYFLTLLKQRIHFNEGMINLHKNLVERQTMLIEKLEKISSVKC